MNGSSGFVSIELGELNCFVNYALSGNGRIAVNKNGYHLLIVVIAVVFNYRTGYTFSYGGG